jgi:hypothetical protein
LNSCIRLSVLRLRRAPESAYFKHLAFREAVYEPANRDCTSAPETKKALIPAPTGVTPAPSAKQKHNEKNDQYSFHLEPP